MTFKMTVYERREMILIGTDVRATGPKLIHSSQLLLV